MDELDQLSNYIDHRIDIICNDVTRWLNNPQQLPTFKYYKDAIKDSRYDCFNARRFISAKDVLNERNILFEKRDTNATVITRYFEYSIWMGTPFNYKEIITHEEADR